MKLPLTALALLSFGRVFAADIDIEKLMSQMTLEEKFGQIQQVSGKFATGPIASVRTPSHEEMIRNGQLGSILNVFDADHMRAMQKIAVEESRLKIPLIFGYDVIHGWRTIFQIPLGETASWDPASCEETAAIGMEEAGAQGIRWTFAPMVDIARDPRWGRVAEGAGEDPWLGSAIAAARVRGFQRSGEVAACAKHWVAYGAAEAGRDYNTVDVSERALREIYFPPFKSALDAGVLTFMTAFNEINGIPATANHFILTDVLRDEWKFKGFVVTDSSAIGELMNHGTAANGTDAALDAMLAGCDMEMATSNVSTNGPALVKSGKLPMSVIDDAVRRILTVKKQIGLFENPYATTAKFDPAAARALARKTAARSMVLLKHENNILPFSKDVASIAVIGPLGDDSAAILGPWHARGDADEAVSLLAGLKQKLPKAKITAVAGCTINGTESIDEDKVRAAIAGADMVILAVGESADMSGEAHSRSDIGLPGLQAKLAQLVHDCGKPYVVALFNGRPLALGTIADQSPAILETWLAGSESGNAIADVLFGDVNPGGKLPISFPRVVGQIPIYYNHKNTGRPAYLRPTFVSKYMDVSNDPQYPFGFGLGYTSFKISKPTWVGMADVHDGEPVDFSGALQVRDLDEGGKFVLNVIVENTGDREGDEVVQLYIRDKVASVTRPVRELRGFQRVTLAPGGKKEVEFELGKKELGFYNREMKWTVEPGEFEIYIGNSSLAPLSTTLTVK
jgi:beta-glucosidase